MPKFSLKIQSLQFICIYPGSSSRRKKYMKFYQINSSVFSVYKVVFNSTIKIGISLPRVRKRERERAIGSERRQRRERTERKKDQRALEEILNVQYVVPSTRIPHSKRALLTHGTNTNIFRFRLEFHKHISFIHGSAIHLGPNILNA